MNYLLDTNIIIYSINGSYPNIKGHFFNIPSQNIYIPYVVKAEIEYGANKSISYSKTMSKYLPFLSSFAKVSFSEKESIIYGKIRKELEEKGIPIGRNDLIIASIALANDMVLVTHNTKEFIRINDLKVEDWTF